MAFLIVINITQLVVMALIAKALRRMVRSAVLREVAELQLTSARLRMQIEVTEASKEMQRARPKYQRDNYVGGVVTRATVRPRGANND